MAVSEKVAEKSLAAARNFKIKLDQLGCPFTEDVDVSWILELMFKPGEPRIRLLQWLFSKFDSKLNDMLDPQFAATDTKIDSRIQRLLFIATTLGLCRYDDVDLIRGVSSQSKQISFMDQLIDIVWIKDTADDPQQRHMHSPGVVSESTHIDEQFTLDCWLADSIAGQEKMSTMFCSKARLLPPDLMKTVEQTCKVKHKKDPNSSIVPDITQLVQMSQELSRNLSRQTEILNELKSSHQLPDQDQALQEKVTKTLRLVLSELSQLVVGFSYVFENEMRQWCNKTPPALTELGPAFKRVHTMLQQFTSFLQGLSTIRTSYTSVCEETMNRADSMLNPDKTVGLASVSQAALVSFQECISVLEDSMRHRGLAVDNSNASFLGNSTMIKL